MSSRPGDHPPRLRRPLTERSLAPPAGPYNSWDRNPYIFTTGDDATPTSVPITSEVRRNFLFCSYGGIKGIDHDDGSGWYHDSYNYMPYCSGKMKGQSQTLSGNVYLFPLWGTQCVHMMGGMDPGGEPMMYYNNTCVARNSDIYTSCSEDSTTGNGQVLANNTYFVAGGLKGFPCASTWPAWQAAGEDVGSTITDELPSVDTMVGWGRELLGF